jgi:hypothetical protein
VRVEASCCVTTWHGSRSAGAPVAVITGVGGVFLVGGAVVFDGELEADRDAGGTVGASALALACPPQALRVAAATAAAAIMGTSFIGMLLNCWMSW